MQLQLQKLNIAIVGMGYVGLPLAVAFGEKFVTTQSIHIVVIVTWKHYMLNFWLNFHYVVDAKKWHLSDKTQVFFS